MLEIPRTRDYLASLFSAGPILAATTPCQAPSSIRPPALRTAETTKAAAPVGSASNGSGTACCAPLLMRRSPSGMRCTAATEPHGHSELITEDDKRMPARSRWIEMGASEYADAVAIALRYQRRRMRTNAL